MKRFSLLCVLALTLCTVAMANIIPTSITITGAGPYTWTYDLQLSSDQNVNSGLAPTSNPVPHVNLSFAGFLTVYDFAGYIGGSCSGPAGWTCTAQNIGFTPDDVIPTDNGNIVNLTWAYTSGPTLLGQPSGIDLGLFWAQSIYGTPLWSAIALVVSRTTDRRLGRLRTMLATPRDLRQHRNPPHWCCWVAG